MRKLVILEDDHHVRQLVRSGGFDEINDGEAYYLVGEGVADHDPLRTLAGANFLGEIDQPAERKRAYHGLRRELLASQRFRSRLQRLQMKTTRWDRRYVLMLRSLPGVRQTISWLTRRRLGQHPDLMRAIRDVRPEIVIVPTSGLDTLGYDASDCARQFGVPSLSLVTNWDSLTSKGGFPVESDYYVVLGEQGREHAERLHRIDRSRVFALGSAQLDRYWHVELGRAESPFPFRYALFAGGSVKFDELAAIEALEREIEGHGLDLKVVYRPHPAREPRDRDDFVDESRFKHIVIDPEVRDWYVERAGRGSGKRAPMPSAAYYPALIENAEVVISPLSTMMLEAGIFERQVICLGYDDGVHSYDSTSWIRNYEYCEGLDEVDGFWVCYEPDDLPRYFRQVITGEIGHQRSLRDQVRWFIYGDERRFAERLATLVDEIVGRTQGDASETPQLPPEAQPANA